MKPYLGNGEGDVATSEGAKAIERLGLTAGGQQHRAVASAHRRVAQHIQSVGCDHCHAALHAPHTQTCPETRDFEVIVP